MGESKPSKKHWLIVTTVAILVTLVATLLTCLLVASNQREAYSRTPAPFEDKIVAIKLSGMIAAARDDLFLLKPNVSESIRSKLYRAAKDKHIKGVLLRIDSPGGTVATSQELWDAVLAVRNSGKPVVASMADVAASGGYYVACACDKIIAEPGTITGSIGVIMKTFNLQGLEQKLGIQPEIVKSGPFKDIGSPYRPMTKEEHDLLMTAVLDAYNQFVDAVVKGRKMKIEAVRRIADGRIFLGRQALKAGLVDDLGGYQYSIDILQKLCHERFGNKMDFALDEGAKPGFLSTIAEILEDSKEHGQLLHGVISDAPTDFYRNMPLWMMQ